MNHTTTTLLVMAVPLLIWIGACLYLFKIDVSLRRLELREEEEKL